MSDSAFARPVRRSGRRPAYALTTSSGPRWAVGNVSFTVSKRYVTSPGSGTTLFGSPRKSVSVVPTRVKSPHGRTNTTRPSLFAVRASAWRFPIFERGTKMWIPFVGRIVGVDRLVHRSSSHTPVTFTTNLEDVLNE